MTRRQILIFSIWALILGALYSPLWATVDLNVDDGGAPLSGTELVTNIEEELADLSTRINATRVPTGGVSHDVIEKDSGTDFDISWVTPRDILTADATNNNGTANTIQDVTGLQFPVVNGGHYWFRFAISYTAAATTTGSRWSINGPTIGADGLKYSSRYSLTTTTTTTNDGLSAYDSPAASNASSAATGSNQAIIEGFLHAGADGNVVARFASEVSSSAVVAKANMALVEYRRLD
jgi:hypothetical protein